MLLTVVWQVGIFFINTLKLIVTIKDQWSVFYWTAGNRKHNFLMFSLQVSVAIIQNTKGFFCFSFSKRQHQSFWHTVILEYKPQSGKKKQWRIAFPFISYPSVAILTKFKKCKKIPKTVTWNIFLVLSLFYWLEILWANGYRFSDFIFAKN